MASLNFNIERDDARIAIHDVPRDAEIQVVQDAEGDRHIRIGGVEILFFDKEA